MVEAGDELVVGEDGDLSLPAADVVTGRGFVTGKSGSGKSNTASVLAEELLALGSRLVVVDTDGEYYGLKEEYELLHVGAGDRCDVTVGPGDAEAIADLVVSDAVPVIVDVSGFLEADRADELVYEVAKHVFAKAGERHQPCLMLVEEVHEFVPEQGGLGDVGEMIVRIAKRGRKRGLGLVGLSQRPAAVDKDFITQCDWLAWHRLTWANDTRVVKRVLGDEYATEIESLDAGEAFLQTDWDESVRRVQFRRKRTYDAGATPGFGETSDPDLTPVPREWLAEFEGESAVERAPAPDGRADDGDDGDDRNDEADATADGERAEDDVDESVADSGGNESTGASGASGSSSDGSSDKSGDESGGAPPAASSTPPADAHQATWELGQLVFYVCRSALRRVASGLRGLGRRTRLAARRLLGAVADSWQERATGTGGASSVAGDRGIEGDGGVTSDDEPVRPVVDLVVGGLVTVVVAAAVLTLAAMA